MLPMLISLIVWLAVSSGSALAQDAPDLVVSLKDINNRPLGGVTVVIRDAGGSRDLARATTDALGVAPFQRIAETDIRVAIQGQLPNGAAFFQPGNDARGVAMFLQPGTNRMNLLADTDGMIAPDPLTMSALEPGVPVATTAETVFPTAPVATTPTVTAIQAIPHRTFQARTTPAVGAGSASSTTVTEPSTTPTNPIVIWLGVGLLILLIGAGVGIIGIQRRWR